MTSAARIWRCGPSSAFLARSASMALTWASDLVGVGRVVVLRAGDPGIGRGAGVGTGLGAGLGGCGHGRGGRERGERQGSGQHGRSHEAAAEHGGYAGEARTLTPREAWWGVRDFLTLARSLCVHVMHLARPVSKRFVASVRGGAPGLRQAPLLTTKLTGCQPTGWYVRSTFCVPLGVRYERDQGAWRRARACRTPRSSPSASARRSRRARRSRESPCPATSRAGWRPG